MANKKQQVITDGEDGRVRNYPAAEFPYAAICKIKITTDSNGNSNGTSYGTGFIISDRAVLTCAHNLYAHGGTPGRFKNGVILLETNGEEIEFTNNHSRVSDKYINNKADGHDYRAYDYGIILFPEKTFSTQALQYRNAVSSDVNQEATLVGYERDHSIGQQHKQTEVIALLDEEFLFYKMDTRRGNSGSPVYDSTMSVIAIHAYDGRAIDSDTFGYDKINAGVRLTDYKRNEIAGWLNANVSMV